MIKPGNSVGLRLGSNVVAVVATLPALKFGSPSALKLATLSVRKLTLLTAPRSATLSSLYSL